MCVTQLSWCGEALSQSCYRPLCLNRCVIRCFPDLHFVKICPPKSKWCPQTKVKVMVFLSSQKEHVMYLTGVKKWSLRLPVFSGNWDAWVNQISAVQYWTLPHLKPCTC
jgi:hypothetical protein